MHLNLYSKKVLVNKLKEIANIGIDAGLIVSEVHSNSEGFWVKLSHHLKILMYMTFLTSLRSVDHSWALMWKLEGYHLRMYTMGNVMVKFPLVFINSK